MSQWNPIDNMYYWPIVVIVLIVYLLWSEYGSQDCSKQSCNNRARVIYGEDDWYEAIDKINHNVHMNHTIVGWRRALLVAIIVTILVLFIFYNGKKGSTPGDRYAVAYALPDGFTVFIVTVIIFVIVYFSSAWIQYSWWRNNDYKIEDSLKLLKKKYKYDPQGAYLNNLGNTN